MAVRPDAGEAKYSSANVVHGEHMRVAPCSDSAHITSNRKQMKSIVPRSELKSYLTWRNGDKGEVLCLAAQGILRFAAPRRPMANRRTAEAKCSQIGDDRTGSGERQNK